MRNLHSIFMGSALIAISASAPCALAAQDKAADTKSIEHGRYLIKTSGCNDCHTPGYAQSGGNVPEQQWLTGDRLGWRGPWGTTYAMNLRLFMQTLSEDQWVKTAHTTQYRPPMPWFTLRDMHEHDLRDIYRFVKYLGPSGEPAPAYLPPDQAPMGPVVLFPQPPK